MDSPEDVKPAKDIVWPPFKPAMKDFAPAGRKLTLCAAGFFAYVDIFERWLEGYNQLLPPEQQIFTDLDDLDDIHSDRDNAAFWQWYQYKATYLDTIEALKCIDTRFGDAESFYSSSRLTLFEESVWYMLDGHVQFYKTVQEVLGGIQEDSDEIDDLLLRGRALLEQAEAYLADTPLPGMHSDWEWCSITKSYYELRDDGSDGNDDRTDGGDDGSDNPPPRPASPRFELAAAP